MGGATNALSIEFTFMAALLPASTTSDRRYQSGRAVVNARWKRGHMIIG